MIADQITQIRLQNQQIIGNHFSAPRDLLNHIGAMQSQDFNQAKWAVGLRLPNFTEKKVEEAYNRGEILRTHLMRPTWHFVSPDNIYELLELSAKQIKSAMKARNHQLELTEAVLKKSQKVIIEALEENHALTRDELSVYLNNAGIKTTDQRLPHILMEGEIDRIICSGPMKGKKHTYALLEERVPIRKSFSQDETLAGLARKYFTSHGPATLADFTWWSGLPVIQARKAIALNDKILLSETINGETYWFSDNHFFLSTLPDTAYLLPAYDEYLISYKNREAAISAEDQAKAISKNGIFWPIVVINGKISGLWKKTVKKDLLIIEINHFRPLSKVELKLLEDAAEFYGYYYQQKVKVLFK